MCDSYGHWSVTIRECIVSASSFVMASWFMADQSLSGQCSESLSDRFSEQSFSIRIQVQPGECFIRVVRWNQKQVCTLDWLRGMWRLVSSTPGIIFSSAIVMFLRSQRPKSFFSFKRGKSSSHAIVMKKKTNFAALKLVRPYKKLHNHFSLVCKF